MPEVQTSHDPVTVEFYGTARLAVRLDRCEIPRSAIKPLRLGQLLKSVEDLDEDFVGKLVSGSQLVPGVIANLDGKKFTRNLAVELDGVKSVLLMSIDVGG